jgi:hypothetical protein
MSLNQDFDPLASIGKETKSSLTNLLTAFALQMLSLGIPKLISSIKKKKR